jgi:hypothetical protein
MSPLKKKSKRACSPTAKTKGAFDSCFDHASLKKIAKAYNNAHARFGDFEPIKLYQSKEQLWNAINERMEQHNLCKGQGEWCWVKQPFVRSTKDDKVLTLTFKPPIPMGKYDWLSTDDIDNVLFQYEHVVPNFKFLGTWPIDFEELSSKFNEIDFEKETRKGIKYIGLVLNEDTSRQNGSHWVGLLIDLSKNRVEFFDSYGKPPHSRVCKWIKKINNKRKKENKKPFIIVWNDKRHQYANSECGVYTIHFIVKRILGDSFEKIVKNNIRDEEMNKKRDEFFNPLNKYNNRV